MTNSEIVVILEYMDGKFDLLVEMIEPLKSLPAEVRILRDDVDGLKSDMITVKAAIRDLSLQM